MWKLYIISITLHFIFDWILQPRYIAKNKKKDMKMLCEHIILNIVPFTVTLNIIMVIWFNYSWESVTLFFMVNVMSHFFIDRFLPSGRNEREMINWTAIDQILHINILILLLQL